MIQIKKGYWEEYTFYFIYDNGQKIRNTDILDGIAERFPVENAMVRIDSLMSEEDIPTETIKQWVKEEITKAKENDYY